MTDLVNSVRIAVDPRCLVRKLRKQGCRISLAGAPAARLIIDFDKAGAPLPSSASRCDYLFVADAEYQYGWVAPLELMKGRLDAGKVVRQLQQGARVAERLISRTEPVMFRPVAVTGGSTSKAERYELKQRKSIRLHGCKEAVRLLKCGAELVATFSHQQPVRTNKGKDPEPG